MSLRASFFLFFDDFFVKLSIITIVSGCEWVGGDDGIIIGLYF